MMADFIFLNGIATVNDEKLSSDITCFLAGQE